MPQKLPVGPDKAIFDRPTGAWLFQAKLDAAAGLGVRPEVFVPPDRRDAFAAQWRAHEEKRQAETKDALGELRGHIGDLGAMLQGMLKGPGGPAAKAGAGASGGSPMVDKMNAMFEKLLGEQMEDMETEFSEEERFETGPAAEGWVQVIVPGEKRNRLAAPHRAVVESLGGLCDAVLGAVRDHYTANREKIAARVGPDLAPALPAPDRIRDLVSLRAVHIYDPDRSGVCDVGFEFECSWRDSGLGVRVRAGRVVAIGSSEKAQYAPDTDSLEEARDAADPNTPAGPGAARFDREIESWEFRDRLPEMAAWQIDESLFGVDLSSDADEEEDWDEAEAGRSSPQRLIGVSFTGATKKGYAPEQLRTYEEIKRHAADFAAIVLKGLYDGYLKMLESGYLLAEDELLKPSSPRDLQRWVQLDGISVHAPGKDGVCEVGFCFRALWDDEHGAGLRLRGREVIDFGHSDTGFLEEWEGDDEDEADDEE